MNVECFVKHYHPGISEYCPITIARDGNVFDSTIGHLQTLIMISGDHDILSKIPKDKSPLFYLIDALQCVIVDYENQIYSKSMTDEQKNAINYLIKRGLIKEHLSNIEKLV